MHSKSRLPLTTSHQLQVLQMPIKRGAVHRQRQCHMSSLLHEIEGLPISDEKVIIKELIFINFGF
jgi:hypothetical protein